jgi:hypothetical protein
VQNVAAGALARVYAAKVPVTVKNKIGKKNVSRGTFVQVFL